MLKTLELPVGSVLIKLKLNSPDLSYLIFNKGEDEGYPGTEEDKRLRRKRASSRQEARERFFWFVSGTTS